MQIQFDRLPNDIYKLILQYLPFNELIQFNRLNKWYNQLVKDTRWCHLTVRNIKYFICGYTFAKCSIEINREHNYHNTITNLGKCDSVKLNYSIIDAEIITVLSTVRKIYFTKCFFDKIDISCYKTLCHVSAISLYRCDNFPFECVPELNICYLNINAAYETKLDLALLRNVKTLVFIHLRVKANQLVHLSTVNELQLEYPQKLNDKSIQCLRGVRMLNLCYSTKVTTAGIDKLYEDSDEIEINTLYNSKISPRKTVIEIPGKTIRYELDFEDYSKEFKKKFARFKCDCARCPTNETLRQATTTGQKKFEVDQSGTVTDDGMQYLARVEDLRLLLVDDITIRSFSYLKCLQKLKLSDMNWITDDWLVHLANLKAIHISSCNNITDRGLKYLHNVWEICISFQPITNRGLKYIRNAKTVRLNVNRKITDKGIYYLRNCHRVLLWHNKRITSKCRKYLTNVPNVLIGYGV